jgi:N-acetylmuramate 1-kinase
MEKRHKALKHFIHCAIGKSDFQLNLLAGDASFRRYYRVYIGSQTYVVMDAPPECEPLAPFLFFAKTLQQLGVCVPEIIACDGQQGFLLLSDFGDGLLLSSVNAANVDLYYYSALDVLHVIQQQKCTNDIATFDKAHIEKELQLFEQWFLQAYLQLTLSQTEIKMLKQCYQKLIKAFKAQPQVLVHRDYHSRNLMWLAGNGQPLNPCVNNIGVIDFQDAMCGPIGYDLVSLLKDCYIEWDENTRMKWLGYFQRSCAYSLEQLNDWVELCGIQRHMKVLGIFSRLYLRDKKSNYLKELPLTLKYLTEAVETNNEFDDLLTFITTRIRLP